ncbi:hypothetical protein [Antribacter gilvus]|uniref:hypothetical protein n=1 Tax=Antribacter gilvus TaxID=2304675 RepID=UPI0019819B57|nr:hypothetical protein [Antribacter gilvus]
MNEGSRLFYWQRIREYAVPPPMIEKATARRLVGDWAAACSVARVDVDVDLPAMRRTHGTELAAQVRQDLRHLAPDLLRWHLPRVLPDGLLRPGLTLSLARYPRADGPPTHLVLRTPPAWAAAGQRMILAWWDGGTDRHPHPHPDPRYRLDLHRHLWDARRTAELAERSGFAIAHRDKSTDVPQDWAVERWAAEAAILLQADSVADDAVVVRLGWRRQAIVRASGTGPLELTGTIPDRPATANLPVLPDAATWIPPDIQLLRAGLISPGALHPLVAEALGVGGPRGRHEVAGQRTRIVECRGALHRLELVDGVLTALDHAPDEIRREELLATLTGTPLPCLQVIDQLYRSPTELSDIRARLDHGDSEAALSAVEAVLGHEAVLRSGALQDELVAAVEGRIAYGLFRAGLSPVPRGPGQGDDLPGSGRSSRAQRVAQATPYKQRDRYSRRLLTSTH